MMEGNSLNDPLSSAYFHHTQLVTSVRHKAAPNGAAERKREIDQNDGIILAHEFLLLIIFRWIPSICNMQNAVSVGGYTVQI